MSLPLNKKHQPFDADNESGYCSDSSAFELSKSLTDSHTSCKYGKNNFAAGDKILSSVCAPVFHSSPISPTGGNIKLKSLGQDFHELPYSPVTRPCVTALRPKKILDAKSPHLSQHLQLSPDCSDVSASLPSLSAQRRDNCSALTPSLRIRDSGYDSASCHTLPLEESFPKWSAENVPQTRTTPSTSAIAFPEEFLKKTVTCRSQRSLSTTCSSIPRRLFGSESQLFSKCSSPSPKHFALRRSLSLDSGVGVVALKEQNSLQCVTNGLTVAAKTASCREENFEIPSNTSPVIQMPLPDSRSEKLFHLEHKPILTNAATGDAVTCPHNKKVLRISHPRQCNDIISNLFTFTPHILLEVLKLLSPEDVLSFSQVSAKFRRFVQQHQGLRSKAKSFLINRKTAVSIVGKENLCRVSKVFPQPSLHPRVPLAPNSSSHHPIACSSFSLPNHPLYCPPREKIQLKGKVCSQTDLRVLDRPSIGPSPMQILASNSLPPIAKPSIKRERSSPPRRILGALQSAVSAIQSVVSPRKTKLKVSSSDQEVQITPKNPSAYSSLRSKRSLFKSASTEENSSKICHRDSTSTNDENKPSVACSSKQPTGKQHPYPRQGSNKIKPMQENINKIKPMQENICPGRKALVSLENKPTPLRPRPVRTEGTLPFGHIASAIKYPGHDEGQLPVVGPAIMGEDISPTKFSKVFRPFSKATKKQLRRL